MVKAQGLVCSHQELCISVDDGNTALQFMDEGLVIEQLIRLVSVLHCYEFSLRQLPSRLGSAMHGSFHPAVAYLTCGVMSKSGWERPMSNSALDSGAIVAQWIGDPLPAPAPQHIQQGLAQDR